MAFDYKDLSVNAVVEEEFLVISIEKLLLMKALVMEKPKYYKDLQLRTNMIMERQYPKNIIKMSARHLSDIYALLESVELPIQGIEENLHNFFIVPVKNTKKLLGSIGLEIYGNNALVRSLAVHSTYHKKGLGTQILTHIHMYAKERGVKRLYLLTTTAEKFFRKFDYEIIPRNEVPANVKESIEFKSVCPESATSMRKSI
ncbi:MAG: arsenic resistance N-acetyltransferase ArsN2 [Candidatus Hodarchaeales archaeon]